MHRLHIAITAANGKALRGGRCGDWHGIGGERIPTRLPLSSDCRQFDRMN